MKVFIKFSIQSVLVMNLEEEGRFICGITCEFVNKWRCEDVDQILLHGDSFFLCIFSRSDVSGKTFSVRSKLEEVMKYHTKQS